MAGTMRMTGVCVHLLRLKSKHWLPNSIYPVDMDDMQNVFFSLKEKVYNFHPLLKEFYWYNPKKLRMIALKFSAERND